ncbi:septal ring lytic transglycosylase RlpA family protein [Actinocorallia sp. API 0066]|uniref:septal ring lytic transglycosylase RlpA family protein n=1 Tax=Actinocorallia sp. API 0066 TaxID=2896846 RepID=UPI001E516993|nr:septal ring lytic transglycosylase RlpA family protein [Actinocorallia sp. API 0066]MCD0448457.1 septal ring lytic transglycosylase RlpA family protein [Actinocorallia sp. API 0066]
MSVATSFWDAQTASGKPMRYRTLASPYWPLGTKVRITYRGRSTVGFVEDFGPAQWAVRQHRPPAIVDLSEKMMAHLTGKRSNVVRVRFEVLRWGKGRRYKTAGVGYALAMRVPTKPATPNRSPDR